MSNDGPVQNMDRELWRERLGDYYADSIHVTANGSIGIDCGGHVIVMPVRAWHALAATPPPGEQGKGADALARLRAERDRYNETEGESGEMPLLEALDAFLDAEPEQGKGGGEGREAWEQREAYRAMKMSDDANWGEFCGCCGALLSMEAQDEECGPAHTATQLIHEWLARNLAPAQPAEPPAPPKCLGCEAEAHPEMDGAAEWVGFHEPPFCKKPHPASGGEEK